MVPQVKPALLPLWAGVAVRASRFFGLLLNSLCVCGVIQLSAKEQSDLVEKAEALEITWSMEEVIVRINFDKCFAVL